MPHSGTTFREKEQEKQDRVYEMLLSSMGPIIQRLLNDDDVIEIMLNPDGCLWQDRLSNGRSCTGETMRVHDAERIIRIVSSHTETICSRDNPMLSAELPGSGARFQGLLPPVVQRPTFTIRKKALMVFTLQDYVKQGIMTEAQVTIIQEAIRDRQNILVAGGTGSGKTTLANAILDEIAKYKDRIVIIEDTLELQCNVEDHVSLRTSDHADMTELLKATMRLRPDRIIVGEVRGGEALALLKAWNTGHPGGLSTVHANGTKQALIRLEQLIQEAVTGIPRSLIADAVDVVVFIRREGNHRQVEEIAAVVGCDGRNEYVLQKIE